MIQVAQNTVLEPNVDTLPLERRYHSTENSDALNESIAEEKFSVKKLLSGLQSRFSDSQDLMALIEAEVSHRTADLYRRANFDALTHLPNRTHFQDMLDHLVQRSEDEDVPFTLLFLDLDGFKNVNDTQGHSVGDELLRHVSARLVSSVREGDIVGRLGGDEFVVLLADTDERDVVETVCKRIIREVSRPYWFEETEVRTAASIGIASYPQDSKIASELIDNADKALYVSKSSGKRTYRFYGDVMSEVPEQQHIMLAEFDEAVAKGALQPVIEPQVDLKQNRIVGGYVSLQWEGQAMSEWQEMLSKSSWEASVALWLLDTGCYYLKQWHEQDAEFVVTVPVLPTVWRQDNLVEVLTQHLARYGVKNSQIQLAFSLNELGQFDELMVNRLEKLAQAGFQITLTDLGAQPLDLGLMARLQVQEFKFDQAWLASNMNHVAGQQWIQALIQMVKSLDACMIATGIELESQVEKLTQWGCTLGQGEYWAQPIPTQDFQKLIA